MNQCKSSSVLAVLGRDAIPTAQARYLVELAYGMKLHGKTYRNWRSWANVEIRAGWITYQQLRILMAIALIRRDQRQYGEERTELDENDILEVANSDRLSVALEKTWEQIEQRGYCLGRLLVERLNKEHDIILSMSTLNRILNGVQTVRYYRVVDVARFIKDKYPRYCAREQD